jgi:hypothetical protein
MYGVPKGWDHSVRDYRRLLEHLPPDLLDEAITAHMAEPEAGDWFPKPAQLLAQVSGELAARHSDLRRATPANQPLPVQRITPEEAEAVKAQYRGRPGYEWLDRPRNARERQNARAAYVAWGVPDTIAGQPWRSEKRTAAKPEA